MMFGQQPAHPGFRSSSFDLRAFLSSDLPGSEVQPKRVSAIWDIKAGNRETRIDFLELA